MKTYKFKLYNDTDSKYLHQKINISGIIYNHCIALYKFYYRAYGKYLNKYKLQKHLVKCKRVYSFWKKVDAQTIQQITDRIDEGYRRFFDNCKKKNKRRVTPPSFKKINKYKSVTYKQTGYKLLEDNKIKIQGRIYRYHKSREVKGKIKTLTVKRNSLNDIFIYITTDDITTSEIENNDRCSVGIDFGLKTFLYLSDGTKINSPLFFYQSLKELKAISRKYSTKTNGSRNKSKAKKNLCRVHEKITNKRKDWFWKLSKELCEKYDVICFEDLNIDGMKRLWGRKVSDLSFKTFLGILEHQAKKHKTEIIYIPRFFPSTKTCSCCGSIQKLELTDREWKCIKCNTVHDRDFNASINILNKGLETLKD